MPISPSPSLNLFHSAEELWAEGVLPWVESGRGQLEQSYIVVPTRGQAQGLKQRFVEAGVPLLGIEFLTPGLARRKWITGLYGSARPAMGRELLLFGLRRLIEAHCESTDADPASQKYWQSLRTDAERALDDWDVLLRSGHRAKDWRSPLMREIFQELEAWIDRMGFAPSAMQERAAIQSMQPDQSRVTDRVLVAGFGMELAGEFWGVAGLVLRAREVSVWLPEPDFAGGETRTQETWIDRWQTLLGTEALPSTVESGLTAGEGAAALLAPTSDQEPDLANTQLVVGQSRTHEMGLVAARVARWLAEGAVRIAVVVPLDSAAHLRLRWELTRRKIEFIDQLPVAGPPSLDVRLQQALLDYHAQGARIEGLLAVWPRLLSSGATTLGQAEMRQRLDRSFEKCQSHEVCEHVVHWREKEAELRRVVDLLGEVWPTELKLADGLARFRDACDRLDIADPEGIQNLDTLASTDQSLGSRELIAGSIKSLLPDQFPATDGAPQTGFAPVMLGSWRRLVGASWTHLVFTQCNASVWPVRSAESPWWAESEREQFLQNHGSDAGLITAAEFREAELAGLRRIARDATIEILFSAALFEDAEPENILAPNAWLERILVRRGLSKSAGGIGKAMSRLARVSPDLGESSQSDLSLWQGIDRKRRDASVPFDEWFYGGDPVVVSPEHVSPRLIERAVQDPAEFWYEAVLGVSRIEREDFQRQRSRTMGILAHDLVAKALRPHVEISAGFGPLPETKDARQNLTIAFQEWYRKQSKDIYWQTFAAELEAVVNGLLEQALNLDAGEFVATEIWLPPETRLRLGSREIPLSGRMDLVRSDQAGWKGSQIDIIDFKTGGDIAMSAKKMGRSGKSLQLGIYLAATQYLGAAKSRVWMIKPGENEVSVMGSEELEVALECLGWLDDALARGVVGARTPDRSEYSHAGYEWPRALRPVAERVLRQKYALTFEAEPRTERGNP